MPKRLAITTDDGLTLGGWFVPASEPARGTTVVVFNGNGGNRASRAPLAAQLARRGIASLLFDYRGYGGNPGAPSEKGLAADARAASATSLRAPTWTGTGSSISASRLGAGSRWASRSSGRPSR